MGKKSLIKSTAKKKTDPKKAGESTTKKAAAKTTKKATGKAALKAKATQKAKPASKAKKLSIKELTFLKFEPIGPVTAKLAAPQPAAAVPTAPPLITAQDAGEADRLHALLAKKFSMAEVKAAAKAPIEKPAAPPAAKAKPAAKKLSVKELTFLKFEPIGPVTAKLAAPQPAAAVPTAPPLITAQDAGEADRLHALLAKKFSMAEVKAAAKAPIEKPAPAPDTTAAKPEPEAPSLPETAPAAETAQPTAETIEAQTPPEPMIQDTPKDAPAAETPVPEPKAVEPPAPEPRPVLKPAKVVRQKVALPKPAHEPEPAKSPAAAAYSEPASQSDPVIRSAKIAAAAAALVILILLAVSASNSGKYYIKPIDNAIEIWRGDFSPKDKSFFMVLHGVKAPEPQKSVYSKNEVFPIIFNYYIDKSDTLLDVEGLPDFEGIKKYLHKAQDYAITSEMKLAVNDRLNTIERMVLLYKADVAISRNTEDSLESAIDILNDAGKLTSSAAQDEEIAQKINTAREKIKILKAPAAAPEAAQPDEGTAGISAEESAAQPPKE